MGEVPLPDEPDDDGPIGDEPDEEPIGEEPGGAASEEGGPGEKPPLPARPDAVEDQGVRRATALMAVGTALSRATGVLRLFALGYALGRVPSGRLLQPRQHHAQHRPGHRPGRDPVGHVRAGVRAPAHHPGRRRGVGRRLRGGERHDDRDRRRVDRLRGGSAVHRRRHHVAQPQRPCRPEPELAEDLLFLFVPQLTCYGFISVGTALLNARRRFGAPMFTPIANNVVLVVVLLVFGSTVRHASLPAWPRTGARSSSSAWAPRPVSWSRPP